MGLDALNELRRRDEENGVDPRAYTPAPPVKVEVGPPFRFPEVDWRQEEAERALRARPREPRPALHVEDTQAAPAKKRPRSKTPNLDEVRSWTSQQVKAR